MGNFQGNFRGSSCEKLTQVGAKKKKKKKDFLSLSSGSYFAAGNKEFDSRSRLRKGYDSYKGIGSSGSFLGMANWLADLELICFMKE